MATNVLLTGSYGRVGTAIIDRLANDRRYEFTYLDRTDHDEYETVVADVSDGVSAIQPAFEGQDGSSTLSPPPTRAPTGRRCSRTTSSESTTYSRRSEKPKSKGSSSDRRTT